MYATRLPNRPPTPVNPDGHPHSAVAEAHPNIALVKYWGKRDAALNLPVVGSLSITLDRLRTRTRVRFVPESGADQVVLNGRASEAEARRVGACLDLLREAAGIDWRAEVASGNDFPTAAGLASSASGFAALVLAGSAALGLDLPPSRLSVLARRGSGSAARSIFGGFVEWAHGERADGSDSLARPLLGAAEWPLGVAVAVTSTAAKEIGSSEGMGRTAMTSPYQRAWVEGQEANLAEARRAVLARDFEALADISEHSCLKMHALALAARPGLLYWNGASVECMHRLRALRRSGVPVFFTIDAGPQVKAVCLPEARAAVAAALREVRGVLEVLECGLGEGARLIEDGAAADAER
ncbi:MAG: diphosphomevalonate decarboxylase [Xanthomonadales bacterium]|nr:diphosphomevalonate decarboxylase [Xanthomonadales bacterium]